jgi:hypothetical protein
MSITCAIDDENEPLPHNNTNVEANDDDEQDAAALFIGDTEDDEKMSGAV